MERLQLPRLVPPEQKRKNAWASHETRIAQLGVRGKHTGCHTLARPRAGAFSWKQRFCELLVDEQGEPVRSQAPLEDIARSVCAAEPSLHHARHGERLPELEACEQ